MERDREIGGGESYVMGRKQNVKTVQPFAFGWDFQLCVRSGN